MECGTSPFVRVCFLFENFGSSDSCPSAPTGDVTLDRDDMLQQFDARDDLPQTMPRTHLRAALLLRYYTIRQRIYIAVPGNPQDGAFELLPIAD